MKYKYIKLDEQKIIELFKNEIHSADIVVAIYKMVFPNWDDIKTIEGWPTISPNTSRKLFSMFMTFDIKHHPDVIPGGAWMNKGFSVLRGENLIDWMVDLSTCTVAV